MRDSRQTLGLYASPAYLKRRGTPSQPSELPQRDALHGVSRGGELMPWTLQRGESRWERRGLTRALTNSPQVSMQMALDGLGVMVIADLAAEA